VRKMRFGNKYFTGAGMAALAAALLWAVAANTAAGHPVRTASAGSSTVLQNQLAIARGATARYANNLALAKKDGYMIITKMIPTMGYHFMNPNVKGFDVRKPPILVYEHQGSSWTLGAIEWVFTSKPATPPLPGATYGSFGAGCHYKDGTFYPAVSQDKCPTKAPSSGAAFTFWHPVLVTMHVWLWYPNPTGLFASTNPLVTPFNGA
jgi:hypothetical protein